MASSPLISLAGLTPPFSSLCAEITTGPDMSRMRSHKGNKPSLPQNKYCSLCPAKFTRTTHLNRHLRSHTNERLHHCDLCSSQFTRSDLLTRHKRTCGDSLNVNKSRRKSCQACAESKIKCDLQYPCTKCSTRGRECVFINDPHISRSKKLASKASPPTNFRPNTASSSNQLRLEPATNSDLNFHPVSSPLGNAFPPTPTSSNFTSSPSSPNSFSSSSSSFESSPPPFLFNMGSGFTSHFDSSQATQATYDELGKFFAESVQESYGYPHHTLASSSAYSDAGMEYSGLEFTSDNVYQHCGSWDNSFPNSQSYISQFSQNPSSTLLEHALVFNADGVESYYTPNMYTFYDDKT